MPMRIRSKIFLGFFCMCLVFSGGVLFCLKTLGPIERSFERYTAENLPVLNTIQNIRTRGSTLHAEILEISYLIALEVTPESERALRLERVEIAHTRKQLLAEMEKYRGLVELYFPDESSYIPLLQGSIDQLSAMVDELLKKPAGQLGSFSLAQKNRYEVFEQNFLAVTNEIVSYENREFQIRREAVSQAVDEARFWIGVSAAVSLGLALALTLIMTRMSSFHEAVGYGGRRVSSRPRRRIPRD